MLIILDLIKKADIYLTFILFDSKFSLPKTRKHPANTPQKKLQTICR